MRHDALHAIIKSLGNKPPGAIAAMLTKRKITGRPGTVSRCPLACMLHNEYGGRFIVGQRYIMHEVGHDVVKVPTPKNIAAFERLFDSGRYPQLIAPPPRCLPNAKPRNRAPKTNIRRPRINNFAAEAGRL